TGQGKTEAGLMWCGDNKCFFVLPLKTAINAMYQRISELIAGKRFTDFVEDDFITISDKSALLHSDIASEYLNKYKNSKADATFDLSYIARSKQMSLPMTVCTPDQIFDFVLKYPGYEYKLATCSYSKFIIDEIQMYSPDLFAAIIYAVKLIHQVGGKVAVLTATLPPFIRQEFIEIFGQDVPMADFSEYGIVRHNVKVSESVMQADNIIEKISELKSDTVKKFLIVCNSIDTADLIYDNIKNYYENDVSISVNLFHAGFIKRDRQKKENDILNASRDNSKTEVWISTSVVEASLDIDFDILFTELSDLFSLFQRFGRVNRKGRKNCDNYNCYVFTELQGNAKRYKFTDETIYKFSKQACMSIDGIITETDKTKLINEYLSVKNIENSEYLKDYRKALSELEKNRDYMKSKSEGLRSIDRTDVIPREVYNQNVDDINKSIDIINDKNSSKSEILEAYDNIQKLTVSVSNYNVRMDKNSNGYLQNNFINCRGVKYPVLENCEYSFEKGIVIVNKDKTEHKDNKNLIDNFI
ncbi:MAG: CRISPR-associated helicase Cas3', partial [Ruminococcus sp.]|nr:CRISPR-associated helicase Cas3' [Ruminococcus sp.]